MNANDEAVYAYLAERADPDGCVRGVARGSIVAALGIADGTAGLALRRLEAAGRLRREPSPGRAPSLYCLTVQPGGNPATQPGGNPAATRRLNPATQPGDLAAPLAGTGPLENPSSSNPLDGNGCGRAGALTDQPGDPATRRPGEVAGSVEVGQAVVAWAVDEQRRLGKPALDGALLGKLGSQAKRMSEGGVEPAELKRAAEYLVEHDMTALDAAHRKALAVRTAQPADRTAERAELVRLAAESKARRDPHNLDRHAEEEMVEVWALLSTLWPRVPLPDETTRAAWHQHLAALPMQAILWGIVQLSRHIDATWPPNVGQVHSMAMPELRHVWERRRHYEDSIDLQRRIDEGEELGR